MKLANVADIGYNGGNTTPLTLDRVEPVIIPASSLTWGAGVTSPCNAVSGATAVSQPSANSFAVMRNREPLPPDTPEQLSFRLKIRDLLETADPDEVDAVYEHEGIADVLSDRRFNNERYALRNLYNANRRRERRLERRGRAKTVSRFSCEQCGARYIDKSREAVLAQSVGDKYGAVSDEFGDRSRNIALELP